MISTPPFWANNGHDRGGPERQLQAAMLWTWHQLGRSVARGRPITLPNLVRLFRRRASSCAGASTTEPQRGIDELIDLLAGEYRRQQPFTDTAKAHLTGAYRQD